MNKKKIKMNFTHLVNRTDHQELERGSRVLHPDGGDSQGGGDFDWGEGGGPDVCQDQVVAAFDASRDARPVEAPRVVEDSFRPGGRTVRVQVGVARAVPDGEGVPPAGQS